MNLDERIGERKVQSDEVEGGLLVDTPFQIILKDIYPDRRVEDWDKSRNVKISPDGNNAYVLLEGELLEVTGRVDIEYIQGWLENEVGLGKGGRERAAV